MHKKGREICTNLGLDSDKKVKLAVSSMKVINWYLLMYLFTYCFYNFNLDYVKVVTIQCIQATTSTW